MFHKFCPFPFIYHMNQLIPFNKSAVRAGDAINEGMSFPGFNYWLFFLAGLLLWVIQIIVSLIPIVSIYIQPIIYGPLLVGMYMLIMRKYDGEEADIGTLFGGFRRFLPAMIVSLVMNAPWILLQTVQMVFNVASFASDIMNIGSGFQPDPQVVDLSALTSGTVILFIIVFAVATLLISLILHITFFCTFPLLADHEISAIDAITLGARAGWSNAWGIFLVLLFQMAITLAGFIMCGVGAFFVLPWVYGTTVAAHRRIFPRIDARPRNEAPPPPSEYGDMYGRTQ